VAQCKGSFQAAEDGLSSIDSIPQTPVGQPDKKRCARNSANLHKACKAEQPMTCESES